MPKWISMSFQWEWVDIPSWKTSLKNVEELKRLVFLWVNFSDLFSQFSPRSSDCWHYFRSHCRWGRDTNWLRQREKQHRAQLRWVAEWRIYIANIYKSNNNNHKYTIRGVDWRTASTCQCRSWVLRPTCCIYGEPRVFRPGLGLLLDSPL